MLFIVSNLPFQLRCILLESLYHFKRLLLCPKSLGLLVLVELGQSLNESLMLRLHLHELLYRLGHVCLVTVLSFKLSLSFKLRVEVEGLQSKVL